MSLQPFKGTQLVVLERRDADGQLDFGEPQPPVKAMEFDAVYQMFFREMPDGTGTFEELEAWLKSKSWTIRAKTW